MAKLFQVTVTTQATRIVNVVADTQEEAQAKVTVNEGETIVSSSEIGEVVV